MLAVHGAKKRGSNPRTHIRILVNGSRVYLHRYLVQLSEGRALGPDEIVHHRDENKHHNCTPDRITCDDPFCFGNLEVLSGDAAAEHCRRHQISLQKARRFWSGKRKKKAR